MKKGNPKENKKILSLFLRRYFVEHSYHDNGVLNHILDDGKLVNHSHTPNAGAGELGLLQQPNPDLCLGLEPLSTYALRDIKKGEEVSTSYEKFGTIVHPCKFLLAIFSCEKIMLLVNILPGFWLCVRTMKLTSTM